MTNTQDSNTVEVDMAKKPSLDTLPLDVLYHALDDLLKVTDEHCHIAGITDQSEPTPQSLHPAILRVNRQLSVASRRYLYTANRFILTHVDIVGPPDLGERLLIKYVGKAHLNDFNHHVLEFHCKAKATTSSKGLTQWSGSYLLREQDLCLFLIKLHGLTFILRADHVYLLPAPASTTPDTPVQFKLRDPAVSWSMIIDIPTQRPLDHDYVSTADQTASRVSLLRLFKNLAGTTCEVTMKGAASQHADSCSHLNARIVSTEAMAAQLMRVLHEWEESLAELFPSAQKMPYVQHAYKLLLDVACRNSLTTTCVGETPIVKSFDACIERPGTDFAIRAMRIDLILTCVKIEIHAWLKDKNSCLMLGEFMVALRYFADVPQPLPSKLSASLYHAVAVLTGPFNPLTNDMQELMLRKALDSDPDDSYTRIDLDLVLRRKRNPGRNAPLSILNSSFVHRPLRQKTSLSYNRARTSTELSESWSEWQQFFDGWTDKRLQLDEATIKMLSEKADARYYGTKKSKSASSYLRTLCDQLGVVSI